MGTFLLAFSIQTSSINLEDLTLSDSADESLHSQWHTDQTEEVEQAQFS